MTVVVFRSISTGSGSFTDKLIASFCSRWRRKWKELRELLKHILTL